MSDQRSVSLVFEVRAMEDALESRLLADAIGPSDSLDARVLRLAHAALLDTRPTAAVGPWELTLHCALFAGYALYVFEQAFKILVSN